MTLSSCPAAMIFWFGCCTSLLTWLIFYLPWKTNSDIFLLVSMSYPMILLDLTNPVMKWRSLIHSTEVGISPCILMVLRQLSSLLLGLMILQVLSALELITIWVLWFQLSSQIQSSWNSPSASGPSLWRKFYVYHFLITPYAPPVIKMFSFPQMLYTAARCSLTVSRSLSFSQILSRLSSPALIRYLFCQLTALTESRWDLRVALVTQLLDFM